MNYISLAFILYFSSSYSSAFLKKHHQLGVQSMHISLKMFHPVAHPWLEGMKDLPGVIFFELTSYCFEQMTFSLLGAIISRHGRCLAKPQINNQALCK